MHEPTDPDDSQHAGQQTTANDASWYWRRQCQCYSVCSFSGREAYHDGEDTPVDDVLWQPGLQLQLSKGALASDQFSNAGAEETSHCSQNHT